MKSDRDLGLVGRLGEVATLFVRLGFTAFGGPAAHVALIERECVERRRWITRDRFLDLLGAANLIPGPTSTELAMHIGWQRAGWPGLVVAGLAFIVPAALLVGLLAAAYTRTSELAAAQSSLAAVQPVVPVLIVQALIPLAGALASNAWVPHSLQRRPHFSSAAFGSKCWPRADGSIVTITGVRLRSSEARP